jgi:hypothetical protein
MDYGRLFIRVSACATIPLRCAHLPATQFDGPIELDSVRISTELASVYQDNGKVAMPGFVTVVGKMARFVAPYV